MFGSDFDSLDAGFDEVVVVSQFCGVQVLPNRLDDERLHFFAGHPAYRTTWSAAPGRMAEQIISVFGISFASMAQTHAIAAIIEDAAGQQGLCIVFGWRCDWLFVRSASPGRHRRGPVENGRLLALQHFTLEADLSNIEAITKEVRERTPRKGYAADRLSASELADLLTMPRLRSSAIKRLRLPSLGSYGIWFGPAPPRPR